MATIKFYTDLNQSKVLSKILSGESADMRYHTISQYELYPCDEIVYTIEFGKASGKDISAWSLSALLSVLPEIQGDKPIIALYDNYITYPHISDLHTKADTLVDACYELILKLHELKML